MSTERCPFCARIENNQSQWESEHCVAFADGYPLSEGHTLVVPREHEADLFNLSPETRADIWHLVDSVVVNLDAELHPDGFNVGVNVGQAAGQTVGHAHVHVIPRYSGDVDDARGGVRWVIPSRAAYWRTNAETHHE